MPKSFIPIADENARVLILGTMPSVESRKAGFYYAHPRNRFWKVIANIFGSPLPQSIEEKTHLILTNYIALWDILASCVISGSDDSSIREPIYNDIDSLVSDKPIKKVLCNGRKSYEFCLKLGLNLPVLYMPSTSPANAAWNVERLIAAWKSELIMVESKD